MDKFSNTFFKTSDAINSFSTYPFHVFSQGGMRSGKTVADDQVCLLSAMHSDIPLIIKVIGQSIPFLRENVYPDYRMLLAQDGYSFDRLFRKTERTLTIKETQILFLSIDEDKALGGQHDIVHVVECNARPFIWEVMHQIMARTKMFGLYDFNPKQEFWYNEHVFGKDEFDSKLIKSTYRDNEYIPEGIKRTLENAQKGTNWYKVFVDGEMGDAQGVIFTNWKRGEWDDTLPYVYGVDFGFHPDPDAIVKVAYSRKENKLYIEEKHYKKENGTADFIRACKQIVAEDLEREKLIPYYTRAPWAEPKAKSLFVCEYASGGSRMIADMRNALLNAIPCQKLPIQERIKLMQNMEIILCGDSPNIERELNNYIFNDVKAGIPIDKWNHAIDAIAYAWEFLVRGISRSQKR